MKLATGIVTGMRQLEKLGINQGTSGNLSIRIQSGFLITPSGMPVAEMTVADIVPMDRDGVRHGRCKPSSEWRMHRDIYAQIPAAQAVVHVHPVHATALACQRRSIPAFHYMVAIAGSQDIPCADYATFGTENLSRNVLQALVGHRACLLANHGLLCYASSLTEAIGLALEIEILARQYLLACVNGSPVLLDEVEMGRIQDLFKDYGRQTEGGPEV